MEMKKMHKVQSIFLSSGSGRRPERFNMKQYQQLKNSILGVWANTYEYVNQNSNTSLEFPYLLIKKQTTELCEVYQRTYWNCPLAYKKMRRLRNIEVELHQLEAAFKWLPKTPNGHSSDDHFIRQINGIFIAARTIFLEFKEDRGNDCEARLPLFAHHIEELIKELSTILNTVLKNTSA